MLGTVGKKDLEQVNLKPDFLSIPLYINHVYGSSDTQDWGEDWALKNKKTFIFILLAGICMFLTECLDCNCQDTFLSFPTWTYPQKVHLIFNQLVAVVPAHGFAMIKSWFIHYL